MTAPHSPRPRPRLSVVVPAYRVQGYLRLCLDSVLEQSFQDFELIAVDDGSPDGCGEIMEEYAARDPRVTAVRLAGNAGLGPARNAGLLRATGDYVLFLDGDDTLAPDALGAIADRLARTGDPDVLVYDYARTYWRGAPVRNRQADVLARLEAAGDGGAFTAADHPQILNLLMVVWNKAYRREFVESHGFTFPPGYYEDTPWTYPVLLTAPAIAVLDRVCVYYRQRRQGGNILRTTSRKHFDVFAQYDRIFAYVDARPELRHWHGLLFTRMTEHLLTILGKPDRLPPAARAEFFRQASAYYRCYRPADFTPPGGVRGAHFALLERGFHPAYHTLLLAGRAQRAARRRLSRARRSTGRQVYRGLYAVQARRPLDPDLAVYASYWYRGYNCNPRAVYEKAKEIAPHVHGVWVVTKDASDGIPPGVDFVVAGSPRYWEVMARATYLVNNVNFPDHIIERPGQVHLQTHHGTPLKKMGLDLQEYPAGANGMNFARLLRRVDRWDYSLSSNRHSTEVWERVYPGSFTALESGYPRNDVYFTAGAEDVLRRRAALGIAPEQTALLYAPTMRDYRKGFVPRLDLERLHRALGPDVVVLARTHYFYREDARLQELQRRGVLVDVSRYPVVEDLCLAADVLVTDYSSIMFDYACLDRPIVVYAPDLDVYAASRGVYFDVLSGRPGETPGATAATEDELIEVFRSGAWSGGEAARLRSAFRERFCRFDDGHAAERVVREVFLHLPPAPAVRPLVDRAPAPSPRDTPAGAPRDTPPGTPRDRDQDPEPDPEPAA